MAFFSQIADAFTLCSQPPAERPVRTTADPPMAPEDALKLLKDGNRRFVRGCPWGSATKDAARQQLVDEGQAPHTAIIGCADSRAPLETIFDAMPGDIFVLRNAGNTCTHAEGSMVGSLEFATGKLGSRLILVLGHTKCGAIYGATKTYLDAGGAGKKAGCALEGLLQDLGSVAQVAAEEMGAGASSDEVAAHAVKVNVFHTMNFLLKFSQSIREGVRSGQIEIQGGIYHLETGSVEFLGKSPAQKELLESAMPLPPSMVVPGDADRGVHGVRTGADERVPSDLALKMLKDGNERFAVGAVTASKTSGDMRKALVKHNQAPHSAILGCADSRVPVDTVFDAMPGELFVLRNAGNTCTHAEGSMVGSLEFCTGKLGTRLILVLGHTQCGAIAGATATYQSGASQAPGCALEGLLQGLASVAKETSEELGPNASQDQLVSHAVKVNVFNSMNFLLKFSEPLRELVRKGELDIQGGIYHLDTGRVQFLGRSPRQAELLASQLSLPPSMALGAIRTPQDGTLEPKLALKNLKDGNERFVVGAPIAKVHPNMREALATKGQAPHTAIVGCADSRVPLETVFDALPGDLFVLRNAGNTCTHAEGRPAQGCIQGLGELCASQPVIVSNMDFGHCSQDTEKVNHAFNLLHEVRAAVMEQAESRIDDRLRQLCSQAASEVKKQEREQERSMNQLLEEAKSLTQKQQLMQAENQALMTMLSSWTAQLPLCPDEKLQDMPMNASGGSTPSTATSETSTGSAASSNGSPVTGKIANSTTSMPEIPPFPYPFGVYNGPFLNGPFPNASQSWAPTAVSLADALGIAPKQQVEETEDEEPDAFVFKLTLRVADDGDLGLRFSRKGEVLRIDSVQSGAAESWNRQCSSGTLDRILRPGDLVISVNEESDPEAMMEECKRMLVKLRILRLGSENKNAKAAKPQEAGKPWASQMQYPLTFPTGLGYGNPGDWTFPWA